MELGQTHKAVALLEQSFASREDDEGDLYGRDGLQRVGEPILSGRGAGKKLV